MSRNDSYYLHYLILCHQFGKYCLLNMKRKESDSVVNSQTGRHLMTKKNKSVSCSKNENDSIKIKNKISPNKKAYSSKNN